MKHCMCNFSENSSLNQFLIAKSLNVDLEKIELKSKLGSMAGGEGFELRNKWRYHPQNPFFLMYRVSAAQGNS